MLEGLEGHNVTLLHYRKSGARLTPVLLGLQVTEPEQLQSATAQLLTEGFVFAELPENSRSVFDRFLQ